MKYLYSFYILEEYISLELNDDKLFTYLLQTQYELENNHHHFFYKLIDYLIQYPMDDDDFEKKKKKKIFILNHHQISIFKKKKKKKKKNYQICDILHHFISWLMSINDIQFKLMIVDYVLDEIFLDPNSISLLSFLATSLLQTDQVLQHYLEIIIAQLESNNPLLHLPQQQSIKPAKQSIKAAKQANQQDNSLLYDIIPFLCLKLLPRAYWPRIQSFTTLFSSLYQCLYQYITFKFIKIIKYVMFVLSF